MHGSRCDKGILPECLRGSGARQGGEACSVGDAEGSSELVLDFILLGIPPERYGDLDDVPRSIRQVLAQSSPAFCVVTDTASPEGVQQSHTSIPSESFDFLDPS